MTKTWTKRQQADHRKKWIAALRSGEYRQARSFLTDGKGFCCLGLACEISRLGAWVDGFSPGEWAYKVGDSVRSRVLPEAVANWLGLADIAGTFESDSLSELNDTGARFKTIADIIESEPEGLIAK